MNYDLNKERTETDRQGNVIRIFYEGEQIYHEYYHCFNCTWTGEIDHYSRFLENCPHCAAGRHQGGLQIEYRWDGIYKDAREQALSRDNP